MARQIFISYRREDEPGMATALYFQLEKEFAPERIFMDVEGGIAAGRDFMRIIGEQVAQCDIMLAIIGKGWVSATDDDGQPRLNNAEDFVRIEIESALRLDKLIIPILINKTDMPRAKDLPDSLRPLALRHAVRLTQERVRSDMQGIVKAVAKALSDIERERAAEEARSWEQTKDTIDLALVEAHLKRFPSGTTAPETRAKLEMLQREAKVAERWRSIKDTSEIETVEGFLRLHPGSIFESHARARLDEIRRAKEEEDWNSVQIERDPVPLLRFLRKYPDGLHAKQAFEALAAMPQAIEQEAWTVVKDSDHPRVLQAFAATLPHSQHVKAVRSRLKSLGTGYKPPPTPLTAAPIESAPAAAMLVDAPTQMPDRTRKGAIKAFIVLIGIGTIISIIGILGNISSFSGRFAVTAFSILGATTTTLIASALYFFGPRLLSAAVLETLVPFKFQAMGTLVILGWMLVTQLFAEPSYQTLSIPGPQSDPYNLRSGQSMAYLLVLVLASTVAFGCIKFKKVNWLRFIFSGLILVIGFTFAVWDARFITAGVPSNYLVSANLNLYGGLALMGFTGIVILATLARRKAAPAVPGSDITQPS